MAAVTELVTYIASTLVDKPESIVITSEVNENSVCLTLSVDPDDMGKVIGKQGRIAKAIRSILRACAVKHGRRYMLDIK
ncbi:MAG: KH domain-containing protein [Clostridia bacterium]|nr:KH domain-containing protein [Clostridia bacterium]